MEHKIILFCFPNHLHPDQVAACHCDRYRYFIWFYFFLHKSLLSTQITNKQRCHLSRMNVTCKLQIHFSSPAGLSCAYASVSIIEFVCFGETVILKWKIGHFYYYFVACMLIFFHSVKWEKMYVLGLLPSNIKKLVNELKLKKKKVYPKYTS